MDEDFENVKRPFFRGARFWIPAAWILGILIIVLVALAFPFGNPQWHEYIYMFQWKVYPGEQPREPKGYTGIWRTRRPDGTLEWEWSYRNGILHGTSVIWRKNGQKAGVRNYRDGKPYGLYSGFYENGQLKNRMHYTDTAWMRKHGRCEEWYENGQKEWEATYVDGNLQGKYTGWHENGQKRSEGVEGKFDIAWYPSGQKELEYTHFIKGGKRYYREIKWAEDGEMMSNLLYYDDYKGKLLEGFVKRKHPNGSMESEAFYKNGKFHGVHTTWYPDGKKKSQASFREGVRHGEYAAWDKDGKLKFRSTYENGEEVAAECWMHGHIPPKWIVWEKINGKVITLRSEPYRDGKPHGVWLRRNRAGKVVNTTFFWEGKEVTEKEYGLKEAFEELDPEVARMSIRFYQGDLDKHLAEELGLPGSRVKRMAMVAQYRRDFLEERMEAGKEGVPELLAFLEHTSNDDVLFRKDMLEVLSKSTGLPLSKQYGSDVRNVDMKKLIEEVKNWYRTH